MESRAKLAGHPVHQMMVVFPLGLLGGATFFDGVGLKTKEGRWHEMSYWMTAAGLVSGGAAAVFGLIDWLAIPKETRARRIGLWHGVGNLVVTGLYTASWALRAKQPRRPGKALPFSFLGFGLAAVTGWLGGELVDRLTVGVDDGAHLNSPNSLSKKPASANAMSTITPAFRAPEHETIPLH